MISLYVKTHNITLLQYFGRTKKDPYLYKGSGKYWKEHLSKHGNDVSTIVVFVGEEDSDELIDFAMGFSAVNNIVLSDKWANLIVEDGKQSGGNGMLGKHHSKETKMKMGRKGKDHHLFGKTHSDEAKKKIGDASRNRDVDSEETRRKKARCGNQNGMYNKKHTEDSRKKMSENLKKLDRIVCPHCGVEGHPSIMKRWHFEKCRNKGNK